MDTPDLRLLKNVIVGSDKSNSSSDHRHSKCVMGEKPLLRSVNFHFSFSLSIKDAALIIADVISSKAA